MKKKLVSVSVVLMLVLLSIVPTVLAEEKGGEWVKKSDLPAERSGATAAVVNEKIYVIGGSSNSVEANKGEKHNTNFVYDPEIDVWDQRQNMPTERSGVTTAVVNNKIYVIGGYRDVNNTLTRTNVVEVYDPSTDSWATVKNMPTARSWASAVEYDGKIYVFGGTDNNNKNTAIVEVYDPVLNTWTSKNNMPLPLCGMGVAVENNKIYIIGGWDYKNYNGFVREYNPFTDSWTQKAPMPEPKQALSVATWLGKIYVFGGYNTTAKDYAEIYDPITNTWSSFKSLTFPRYQNVSAIVNGNVYVIGGTTGGQDGILKTVEMYTLIGSLNLTAVGGNSQVTLNWNSIEGTTGYKIERSTNSGGPYISIASNVNSTDYVDTDVTNGATYYYRVIALNGTEDLIYSNEASATPQAPISNGRAILVIMLQNGIEKEYDLSMDEVNAFIDWYENKSNGIGTISYAINKYDNNKGPFNSRKDYIIFDKIITFEVNEYDGK